MSKDKELQIRLTHADCINNQKELIELLKRKIERNKCLSYDEREYFPDLIADSLFSQGWIKANHKVYDNTIIPMGSVHTFALHLLDIRTSKVKLKFLDREYIIDIADLWKTLYNYLLTLFPRALEEALHISREVPQREESSSYIFSSDQKL